METVIRDNLFEADFEAEVFWFNCRICGKPLELDLMRSIGFCSRDCQEAEQRARRAAKRVQLQTLLEQLT